MKERQEVKKDKYRREEHKKVKLCNELYVSKEYCRPAM
jgi:hypothetical protein